MNGTRVRTHARWSGVVALVLVGCSARQGAPVTTHEPPPASDSAADPPAATLADLHALIAAAPVKLRAVHELVAPEAADAPPTGALAWTTTLPLSMELQVAATGPVAITLDGARVFAATAPVAGALVPAEPLYVGRGELRVVVERGPAVVGFVAAILDENPPASAFRDDP